MANLPPPLSMKSVALSGASSPSSSSNNDRKLSSAEQLILDLSNPELRENALHELSKVISLSPNSLTREFLIVWVFVFCVLLNGISNVFGCLVR
jgi:hypothetical protein